MANLSQAITKSLLNNLPSATAKEFDLDETRVKEFLQTFLNSQLGKTSGKSARTTTKGTNGKGRISGFILFSNETRPRLNSDKPELKFNEVGRELGHMWKALSDSERAEWVEKASAINAENGLPPKQTTEKKGMSVRGKKQTTTTGKTTVQVSRHSSGKFVITGTQYVVKSTRNTAVIGKLRGNSVVVLNQQDIEHCKQQGWQVEAAPPKSRGKKPVKQEMHESENEEEHDDDDGEE
jgi:hypothetical protein